MTTVKGDEVIAQRGDEYLATGDAPYYGRLVDTAKGLAFTPVFVPGILGEEGWSAVEGVDDDEWATLAADVVDVPAPPDVVDAYEELTTAWDRALALTGSLKEYRILSETKGLLAIGRPEALAAFEVKAASGDDEVVELEVTEEEFWANQDWLREVRRLREAGGLLAPDAVEDDAARDEARVALENARAARRAEESLRAAKSVTLRYGVVAPGSGEDPMP